jgi:integrase
VLGNVKLKDINNQLLQSFVSTHTASPKSVRNLIALLRSMWTTAKAWEHVRHDPFAGLVLPKINKAEQPSYGESDLARIIATAPAPYHVICWLLWETGIRRGEVCALDVGHIDLTTRIIVVRYSRSGTEIKTTKSRRPRVFSLSPELGEALRFYVEGRGPTEPLFLTANSKRLHPDNFVKRELRPVLDSLGLTGGCHAFRHGNATAQDRLGTPMKVRQERLGHVDAETTMGYTHMISDDDRRVSAQLGQLIAAQMKQKASGIWPQLAPTSEMQAV